MSSDEKYDFEVYSDFGDDVKLGMKLDYAYSLSFQTTREFEVDVYHVSQLN